jgi:hypothetical protein
MAHGLDHALACLHHLGPLVQRDTRTTLSAHAIPLAALGLVIKERADAYVDPRTRCRAVLLRRAG